jgi:hypothetical protein
MYQEARTWMRTTGRMSEEFEIKVGLYGPVVVCRRLSSIGVDSPGIT